MAQPRALHRRTDRDFGLAIQPRPEAQRPFQRQMFVQRQPIVAQRLRLRHLAAASRRLQQAGQQAQQAGFADSIGAGEQPRLSRLQRKTEAAEQDPPATHTAQRLGFEPIAASG